MPKAPGSEFEQEFGDWMKAKLGHVPVKYREKVKGDHATMPWEVDIHAERFDERWDTVRKIGIAVSVLAILVILLPTQMRDVQILMERVVSSLVPKLAGSAVLVLGLAGVAAGFAGKKWSTVHVWVECKGRKTTVKRQDVLKLADAVADVRENAAAAWEPGIVILASASGFEQDDALSLARKHEIQCYRRGERGFERID